MNKLTTALLCLVALLALPATASAAKPVKYAGKTSSGHKVTFKLVRASRPSISSPARPSPASRSRAWEFPVKAKPAFHYNEVTMNYRVTSKKLRNGTIKGHLRWQYELLIPKYPMGTFSIYSCLGEATFTAKPRR